MKKVITIALVILLFSSRMYAGTWEFSNDKRRGSGKSSSSLFWGVLLTTVGTYLAIDGFQSKPRVNKSFRLKEINWGKGQNSSGYWYSSCSGIIDNTGNVPVTVNLEIYYTTGYYDTYDYESVTVNPGESQGWKSLEYTGSYEPINVSVEVGSVKYGKSKEEKQIFSNQAEVGIAVAGLGIYIVLNHFVQKTRFAKRTGLEIQMAARPGYYRLALDKRF